MSNLTWTFLVVTIIVAAIDLCLRNKRAFRALKKGYMATVYPILGTVFMFRSPAEIFKHSRNMAKIAKQGYGYTSMGISVYNAFEASEVEAILSGTANSNKSKAYEMMHTFLGDGLFASRDVSTCFKRRRILLPTFHFNILQQFYPIFSEESSKLMASIKETCDNEEGIDVCQMVPRFTLNIICETAMGVKLDDVENSDQYRKTISSIGEMLVHRITRPWLYSNFIYNYLSQGKAYLKQTAIVHKFSDNIIRKRRQTFLNNKKSNQEGSDNENIYTTKKRRYAMLDTLLEAENENLINNRIVCEEVDAFVFGGFDTISSALTYTLLMIGTHQQVQQDIYEEIEKVLQNRTGSEITSSEYNDLNFLDRVIKETFRLYPPAPLIGRQLGADLEIKKGMVLPKGMDVYIHIFDLHRDPNVFENPEKFDPDRFLPENIEKRNPYAYIPFSAGVRNCMGQKFAWLEMKTVLVDIIRNFRLKALTKEEELVFELDLVLKTHNPVRIQFIRRDQTSKIIV